MTTSKMSISRYGSEKGDARYDLSYDINSDGKINICDVVIACASYGKT